MATVSLAETRQIHLLSNADSDDAVACAGSSGDGSQGGESGWLADEAVDGLIW